MKTYKNKDGKWCFDFTVDGLRIRRIIGLSKQECEEVAMMERKKIKRSGFGLQEPRKNVFFEDFARQFLELYSKQNKKSWGRDVTSLDHLVGFFKGKLLSSIGPADIEKYRAMRKAQVSPSTVNREVACLKTIFNKAIEWGKADINPAKTIKKFKEPNPTERILTEEEMRRLLANAAPHLKPILLVALNTGMRKAEILELRWENVNFIQRYIYIEDSKSGKSRKVPMNHMMDEALKMLSRNSEFVFFNQDTRTNIRDIKTGFKAACRRAGIKALRIHDLRHTAASKMIEAGIDLVTVSKILGHSSIQMTMRYAHPTPENMQRAVDCLGEIFSEKQKQVGKNPVIAPVEIPATHSYFSS